MATTYRIHPAIGIARVGDSPSGYFLAPETSGVFPDPTGGFKDPSGKVKRQAVRFRIFAYADDGTPSEVTGPHIAWTVHLVNAKAAQPTRGNPEPVANLTIDPGPRTLDTPGTSATFDGGVIKFQRTTPVAVPLGEMRVGTDGSLLVLGGAGAAGSPSDRVIADAWANPQWWDDIADGPVTAVLTLPDGTRPPVEAAWVVTAPPKFAPHQDSVVTLWDRLRRHMSDIHLLPATEPATSYPADVEPILQRARDTGWVRQVRGSHAWPLPVTDQDTKDRIISALSVPPATAGMPLLRDASLTPLQYQHMLNWQSTTSAADPGPSASGPDDLDRAALEGAVGAPLEPGIEVGGKADPDAYDQPIFQVTYVAPFRIDPATPPGTLTRAMAVPWQADFWACTDEWWPVPRPDVVLPEASADGSRERWERGVATMDDMVRLWSSLGFVVDRGDQKLEVDRADLPDVTVTPAVVLGPAPAPLTVAVTAGTGPHTYALTVPPGNSQLAVPAASTTIDGTGTGHLWLATTPGRPLTPTTVTVTESPSGRTWPVTVSAAMPSAAPRPAPARGAGTAVSGGASVANGPASRGDDRQTVLKIEGVVVPDVLQRITFPVCAADSEVEIVLEALTGAIDLRLKSPNGAMFLPGAAAQGLTISHDAGSTRIKLTPPTRTGRWTDHYGTWQVLLSPTGHADPLALPRTITTPPRDVHPYSLHVFALSTVILAVSPVPEPGGRVVATVSEDGHPLDAVISAVITGPDGTIRTGPALTPDAPGDYLIQVHAHGKTSKNQAFSRTAEATVTRAP